jgi:hypothetical protein
MVALADNYHADIGWHPDNLWTKQRSISIYLCAFLDLFSLFSFYLSEILI